VNILERVNATNHILTVFVSKNVQFFFSFSAVLALEQRMQHRSFRTIQMRVRAARMVGINILVRTVHPTNLSDLGRDTCLKIHMKIQHYFSCASFSSMTRS